MASDSFDLVIVGGGPVGGLLALALADLGLRPLVLDAAPAPVAPRGHPALRVSALSEASQRMLFRVGAWQRLAPERLGPYRRMEVWDGDGTGRVEFDAVSVQAEQLGWIVENDAVTAALYQEASARGLPWRAEARIGAIRAGDDGWLLSLADGETLHAPLLVGADGARSLVREAAGIATSVRDSGHVAVVGVVNTEHDHGGCARQRFIDSGPLALLPLFGAGRTSSLVWSVPPDEARRLLALDDAAFGAALTRAAESCLGQCLPSGPRGAFPIRPLHASEYVRPRLALVGDAAHVVHPLAGQGVNLGLLDAAVLAEEIARARAAGLPLWHDSALRRYQRRRRAHNGVMLHSLNGMKTLFELRDPRLRLLRNLGLNGVQRLPPLKRFFVREALGRIPDLPALAR